MYAVDDIPVIITSPERRHETVVGIHVVGVAHQVQRRLPTPEADGIEHHVGGRNLPRNDGPGGLRLYAGMGAARRLVSAGS